MEDEKDDMELERTLVELCLKKTDDEVLLLSVFVSLVLSSSFLFLGCCCFFSLVC